MDLQDIVNNIKKPFVYITILIAVFLFLILPSIGLESFTFSLLILVIMYCTFASSWNVLGGFAGYTNFGHGVFFGLGAYTTAIIMKHTGISPFLTAPLAGLVASIVALTAGYPALRLRGIYFSIATISINNVFLLLLLLSPVEWTGGAEGIMLPMHPFSPYMTEVIFYWAMLIVLFITVFTAYRLRHSKIGIGLISIREDEAATRAMGVPTTKLKLIAYAISAYFPGVIGGLFSYYTLYIDPPTVFAFTISLYVIGIVFFGGAGTISGPLIGGIIFMMLAENLRYGFGVEYEGLHLVILGSIVMAFIMFMRVGLIGWLRNRYKWARKYLI